MIAFTADGRILEVEEGTSVLQACLANGIYIPNLCYIEGMPEPPASCRLCLVEVEGEGRPVTACTLQAASGMVVRTGTEEVRRLQRSGLRLLLSAHEVDCARCPANRRCELQRLAKFLKVGLNAKRLDRLLKQTGVDASHPFLEYHPNRCVLCGRCVYVCAGEHGRPYLTFAGRGLDTVISFFGEEGLSAAPCRNRYPCAAVCPVGALVLKNSDERNQAPADGDRKP